MKNLYVIVIKLSNESKYLKVTDIDQQDQSYIVELSDYINASVFDGEQVEEIIPILKNNNTDAYIYAQEIGKV